MITGTGTRRRAGVRGSMTMRGMGMMIMRTTMTMGMITRTTMTTGTVIGIMGMGIMGIAMGRRSMMRRLRLGWG